MEGIPKLVGVGGLSVGWSCRLHSFSKLSLQHGISSLEWKSCFRANGRLVAERFSEEPGKRIQESSQWTANNKKVPNTSMPSPHHKQPQYTMNTIRSHSNRDHQIIQHYNHPHITWPTLSIKIPQQIIGSPPTQDILSLLYMNYIYLYICVQHFQLYIYININQYKFWRVLMRCRWDNHPCTWAQIKKCTAFYF